LPQSGACLTVHPPRNGVVCKHRTTEVQLDITQPSEVCLNFAHRSVYRSKSSAQTIPQLSDQPCDSIPIVNFKFTLLFNFSLKIVSILAQQLLGFLVLSNLALAVRFQFGIEEVTVGTTRDNFEDDGLLVVASYTGSGNKSNDWELGSLEEGDSIKWTNLTQEIDVPSGASNLSVAIGVSNAKDADEELVSSKSAGSMGTKWF
jgi:hypothetical protein